MEKGPWRNHTVPKVLLKFFLNDRGRIWTKLVEQDRIVQLALNDASVRGGFHTKEDGSAELERFLDKEVEAPFGRVLDRDQLSIPGPITNPSVKRVVAIFFLSQFLRVVGARAAYRTRGDAFVTQNIEAYQARMEEAARRFGVRYGSTERRADEERLRSRIASADMHIDFTKEMILRHAQELEFKRWTVLQIPFGQELVLSDAPAKAVQPLSDGSIRVLDHQGIARPDVLLFMPLSPFSGLIGTDMLQSDARTLRVEVLNGITAMDATQVYARTKQLLRGG
jgi:hypothetical protein